MKSWLKKFQISNALNDRKPLPPEMAHSITQSDELNRFADASKTLERELKKQLPLAEESTTLHNSIMRAVRTAAIEAETERQPRRRKLAPAGSIFLLVILGVFLALEIPRHSDNKTSPADFPGFADASSALELGHSIVREGSVAAISPLSDELQHLDRDLDNTKQFLLASLP